MVIRTRLASSSARARVIAFATLLATLSCTRVRDARHGAVLGGHAGPAHPTLVVQSGHPRYAKALAWSPDGRSLATRDETGDARLWDGATGALRATLDPTRGLACDGVCALAWSPSGGVLALAGTFGDTLVLWDLTTDAPRTLHRENQAGEMAGRVTSMAWSPSGDALATLLDDGAIRVWRPSSGASETWPAPASPPSQLEDGDYRPSGSALSWSPDGRTLAVTIASHLALLDAQGGAVRHAFDFGDDAFVALAWTRDGRSLAALNGGELRVIDAGDGRVRATTRVHGGVLAWSPDGSALALGQDHGAVRLWGGPSGAPDRVLTAAPSPGQSEAQPAVALSWSADGETVETFSTDGFVRAWDLRGAAVQRRVNAQPMSSEALGWSPDGRSFAAVVIGETGPRVWDATTGAARGHSASAMRPLTGPWWAPDGRGLLVRTWWNSQLEYWDLSTMSVRWTSAPRDADSTANFVVFDPSGRSVLWGPVEGRYAVLDATTGALRSTVEAPGEPCRVQWDPDGTPHVISVASGPSRPGRIISTVSSPTCDLVAVNAAGSPSLNMHVDLWDATAASTRSTLRGTANVEVLGWRPDGRELASGASDVGVWDVATATLRGTLMRAQTPGELRTLAWSGDGASLAALTSDGRMEFWDAAALTLRRVTSVGATSSRLVWSPDHRTVAMLTDSAVTLARASDGATLRLEQFDAGGRAAMLAYTRDGLFTGDDRAFDRVAYRLGPSVANGEMITADQLFEQFHRPDLVADFLADRAVSPPAEVARGVGLPPEVSFVALPVDPVNTERLTVRLRALDRGAGVSDLRVYVNGTRADAGRGLRVTHELTAAVDGAAVERAVDVLLAPGENELIAEAYNDLGHVRSARVRARVTLIGEAVARPDLHLVAVSLDNYEDPAQPLEFSNRDGDAVAEALSAQAGRLYGEVHVTRLRDADATRERLEAALRDVAGRARTTDAFALYVAGHGVMLQCPDESGAHYRLLTYASSLRSEATLCASALSDEQTAALVRAIPARKKLLILDTCQSGAAASERVLLAMRGAQEVDAVRRLARAEGVAVIAASMALQSAGEARDLGHGLFTWALLQGLHGEAALQGGDSVSVFGLLAYVQDAVPRLSRRYTHRAQYPITGFQGQDFPLALR